MNLHILIDTKKILTEDETQRTLEPLRGLPFATEIALLEPRLFPSSAPAGRPRSFPTLQDYFRYLDRSASEEDHLLRVRTSGHPLSVETLTAILRHHLASGNDYTFADGGRVMLYELSFEAMKLCSEMGKETIVLPDGTLELKKGKAGNYLLDREEMAFYLKDHFPSLYGAPRNIMVEVSTQCNLRCRMCFYYAPGCGSGLFNTGAGLLGLEPFRQRVDRIRDVFGAYPVLDLNGRGEPLLNPDLPAMVQYAKMKGFTCYLSTNGSLLGSDLSEALLDAGLDKLAVSLDAVDGETYSKIRKGGDYDLTIKNIQRFLDIREKQSYRKTELLVKMILQPENGYQYVPFVDLWGGIANHIAVWGNCETGPEGSRTDFRAASFDGFDACVSLWGNFMVTLDGKIYPCCLICSSRAYEDALGSMDDLDHFWTAPKVQEYRRLALDGHGDSIPFCKGCRYRCAPVSLKRGFEKNLFYKKFHNMISYSRC